MNNARPANPEPFPMTPHGTGGQIVEYVPQTELDGTMGSEPIIRQYWRIIYRHRWLMLAVLIACIALSLVLSLLMQREYTAEVRLEISRESARVVDVEEVNEDQRNSATSKEFYQTQYELLQSRSLAEAVVRDLRLSENFAFLSDYNAGAEDDFKSLSRVERVEEATERLMEGIEIAPVRDSSIVDVRYTDHSPAMAASIANSVAENFIEETLERRFNRTRYARDFLEQRLQEERAKLEDSERAAAGYARRENLITIAGDGQISGEQLLTTADLAALSQALADARARRIRAEADYAAASGGLASTTAYGNTGLNVIRQRLAERRGELSKLQSDFGPDYPQVVALQAEIAELEREIAAQSAGVENSVQEELRERFEQARLAENQLQARVDRLKGAVLDEQQRAITFNIMQRDVDTSRELYEALLQRYKEVGIAGGVGTNNVSIVDRAREPEFPSSPNLWLNMSLGLVFGLMLGGASVFVREQLADTAILPGDFKRKIGIPLLATSPRSENPDIISELDHPRSEISEAYFSALTSIQFASVHGTPSTLFLTSALPNEGKSTSAVAIARSMAAVGAKVLMIDADMRNPSFHRLLKRPLGPGLAEVLAKRANYRELLSNGGAEELDVLLAGAIPPNPAELLASGEFEKLLDEVRKHYDNVVIDGPPILGLADAPQLARTVEGTVIVMEAGRTRAAQAKQAIDRLRSVRANILGAVLTKLDAEAQGYGYGYGYSYRYGEENS